MPANGPDIIKRYDRLKGEAATHFSQCDAMAPYLAPSRVGVLTKQSPGEKQNRNVFDSTSMMAAELMANFVSSIVINPAQPWGSMSMRHPRVQGNDDVQEWLEECRGRMMKHLAASMFYAEGPEAMIDWGGFGTGFLLMEEQPHQEHKKQKGFRGFYCEAQKTGRFVIADGPDGLVHTAKREFQYSAGNIVDRWGKENLPENVKKALEKGERDKPFDIVHSIEPRSKADQTYQAGNKAMPWASCWVERETKHVVHESGYKTFPGSVFRYNRTPGEVFGRGRGHLAFPDTWTLNTAKKMGLEDWALKMRPPVLMRHDSVIGTLRLVPAGPTSVNTHGGSIRDAIAPFETGSNPQVSQLKEEELRKTIRQIFYVEQILALMEVSKSEMTAFEFSKKLELLFKLMGPVYGRTEHEFLRQIWDTAFDLLLEAGEFSPPPQAVFETDGQIDVEFQNPLARSQRTGDVEAVSLSIQDLTPLAQVYPQVWDRYDPDKTAAKVFEARGVPATCARNEDEIAAIRQARQEQEQGEQALAEAGQVAESMGKAAPMLTAIQGGRQ